MPRKISPQPCEVDENFRRYATDLQWEAYVVFCEEGSERAAARRIGKSRCTVRDMLRAMKRTAARQGYAPPDITHEVPDGLILKGTSIRYNGDGEVEQYWNKTRLAGRDPEEIVHLPDPKKIVKVSTLYDQAGAVTQQWISEKPEDVEREKAWIAFAEGLADKLEPVSPITPPEFSTDDQLAIYGVGDHHMGQLSWPDETGNDPYDINISGQLLGRAVTYLVGSVPATRQALMMFLGDFTHTDGYAPLTPASGNLLDADSRFPKIAAAAGRAMVHAIDTALAKHEIVTVIVTAGNHDPVSAIWLRIALQAHYKNEPRVTINMQPRKFHYFEWGRNLIGATHGDRIKLENLPSIMATDQPEAWGRTLHRFWLTGHVHNDKVKDLIGAKVISVRVLAPPDAYTVNAGYRTPRDMKAIILHREFGESGTVVAPAAMFTPLIEAP